MQKVVTFGEIMLRLATPGYTRFIQSNNLNNFSEISFFAASNFSLSGGLSLVLT